MIIGAQLFTIRDFIQTEKDFYESMKKISQIGFTCVQLSSQGDIPVASMKKACDEFGLDIVTTHVKPSEMILSDINRVIEEHKILGARYVGLGSMPKEYKDGKEGIERFIADFTTPAKKIADAGMKFMYHNHNFEFEKIDGKLMFDYFIEGFPKELVGYTLDTYWVQAGGADPMHWLRKLSGRIDTIHFKDMCIVDREMRMAPIMEGNLNWSEIFKAAKDGGAKWAFIEQDRCYDVDPFECLKTSFDNLMKVRAQFE